jgi:hypothetical protein
MEIGCQIFDWLAVVTTVSFLNVMAAQHLDFLNHLRGFRYVPQGVY